MDSTGRISSLAVDLISLVAERSVDMEEDEVSAAIEIFRIQTEQLVKYKPKRDCNI